MKFLTISVIVIGILVLFNLGGITTPVTGRAVNIVGYTATTYKSVTGNEAPLSDFFTSEIVVALAVLVLLTFGIGAKAGLIGSAPPIQYYLGNLAVVLMGGAVMVDMITLVTKLWSYGEGWMRGITLLIFIPLSFIYLVALKSFWEGTDY